MGKLKSYFESVGFDENNSNVIASCFTRKEYKKDEYFVKEGRKSLELGFLEIGQFQYYSITTEGEERTTYVSLENTFVASLLSYLNEVPARENIKSLTNAILWVIEKKDVIKLQKEVPFFKDFYIKLIEWQICCIDKSRFDLITLTAEQRYIKLLKEEPEFLQRVPLQYIASILGVTPRHLSRLRNKI